MPPCVLFCLIECSSPAALGCDSARELQHLAASDGFRERALGMPAVPGCPHSTAAAALASEGPGSLPLSIMTRGPTLNSGASSLCRGALSSSCGRRGGSRLFSSRCDRVGPATQGAAEGGWGRWTWGQHVSAGWQGSPGGQLACAPTAGRGESPARPGERAPCFDGSANLQLSTCVTAL